MRRKLCLDYFSRTLNRFALDRQCVCFLSQYKRMTQLKFFYSQFVQICKLKILFNFSLIICSIPSNMLVYLSVHLSVCLSVHLSVCLSVFLIYLIYLSNLPTYFMYMSLMLVIITKKQFCSLGTCGRVLGFCAAITVDTVQILLTSSYAQSSPFIPIPSENYPGQDFRSAMLEKS